jgi:spermidine/putrescine transport system permease protein
LSLDSAPSTPPASAARNDVIAAAPEETPLPRGRRRAFSGRVGVETRRGVAFASAPALLLCLAFVVPLIVIIYASFRTDILGLLGESTYTLDAYRRFFEQGSLQHLLAYSIVFSLGVAVLAVTLAYPAAYYLAFRVKRRRMFLVALLIVPSVVSYLLRVLAIKILLQSSTFLLAPLGWVGLMGRHPEVLYTRGAVFITLVYVWIPFAVLPLFAGLTRINPNAFESSADLGARGWQTFLYIVFPQSMPGVIAAMAYVFIPTVGEWVAPALVGGSRGRLFGNVLADTFTESMDWSLGSALSNMMLLSMVVLVGACGLAYVLIRRRGRQDQAVTE